MSEEKQQQPGEVKSEEEQKNNLFSFIVGILIGLAIIIAFVLLFH